jgi:hypothetical protein
MDTQFVRFFKCDNGVFISRDTKRMTIQQGEAQEADAREILPNVGTWASESLGNILRLSLMEGSNTLSNSKSKITENNLLAATATLMSRKPFESKELQHAIQNSLGTLTTKLCSTRQDVCKIVNIGWKESQGKQFYQNQLGQVIILLYADYSSVTILKTCYLGMSLFAASRKNKEVIDINDDDDDNHYQLKTLPPAM